MTPEEQIMSEDERQQVDFMWNLIPQQDRQGMDKSHGSALFSEIQEFLIVPDIIFFFVHV